MPSRMLAYSAFGLFVLTSLTAAEGFRLDRLLRSHAHQFRVHHYLGFAALAAIVTHVVFEFATLSAEDRSLLFDISDPALASGWLALGLLLLGFIAIWQSRRFGHRCWLRAHWIFLAAIGLAAVHGVLFTSGMSSILLGLSAGLALLPCIKYLPARLGGKLAGVRYPIQRITALNDNMLMLEIAGPLHAPFKAGHLAQLRFIGNGFSRRWHPFSVASCCSENLLRLLIRPVGTDTKQLLSAGPLQVDLRGPFRDICSKSDRDEIWIAGGMGIAPFVGMAACLGSQSPAQRKICLLHFHRADDQTAPLGNLDAIAHRNPQFAWQSIIHPDTAGQAETSLQAALAQLPAAHIVVCGPPAFMQWVRARLADHGVKKSRIHAEEWTS